MRESVVLPMQEPSQVGEARRIAVTLADRAGFSEERQGRVALIVTEAGTNLVRHAHNGELILTQLRQSGVAGLEMLALDQGPGIERLDECMRDGFSTAGTAGGGMGAIRRMSDQFDLYTQPGVGTAVVARVWQSAPTSRPAGNTSGFEIGGLSAPLTGESRCGDAWACWADEHRAVVMVADGLGHGPAAADASAEAVECFYDRPELSPDEILEAVHLALRGTRGAAVAVCEIRRTQGNVRFAGVGNIGGVIVRPEDSQHMVSHHGTIGHLARRFQSFTYDWTPDSLLLMYSDGLTSQWRLDRYPGLIARHPSLIAGTLYRDFKRERDDTSIVAVRYSSPRPNF